MINISLIYENDGNDYFIYEYELNIHISLS